MIRPSSRAVSVVFTALVALLALAGCGMDSRPVARVGRHTITLGEFKRAASHAGERTQLPAAQAMPALLDEMVRDELLLVAAEAHGVDTTTFTRQHRRAATEQALLAALSAQLAPQDAGVTEAEARQFYEWRKVQSNVQLVFSSDSAMVAIALARIQAGEPMEQVADHFSDFGTLPPGGKIGYRQPGAMPQPIDDAARTLPVGRVGGPYQVPVGWFLLRVNDRKPATQGSFAEERPAVENMLRRRKWQGALIQHVGQLAPQYHLVVAPDAAQAMFGLLSATHPDGLAAATPGTAARARVLATYDGGAFTVGDAWDDLGRTDINKPNATQLPAIRAWVRDRAVMRLALVEARRRHLDEDPAVAGPLADEMRQYILRSEYQVVISGIGPPDEAALRAAWEPLKARYPMVHEAHVVWAAVADTAKAMAVAQAAGHGSLRDIVHAVDPSIAVHEETIRFPSSDPTWARAQGEFQQIPDGQWASPEPTPQGFRMVQLVSAVRGPLEWDQLPQGIRQSLATSLMQRSRDARIAAYTDSLRRVVQPMMMPDALRGLAWPAPAGTP